MTKKDALKTLTTALTTCDLSIFNAEQNAKIADAIDTANGMIAQLSKPHASSSLTKASAASKRAIARAAAIKSVVPIVRDGLKSCSTDVTAADLYASIKPLLPADWNVLKVQYLLLHDMASEIVKTEIKGKPNTYRLA